MLNKMWRTLRKFGLDHCDLPTMFWNLSVFLRPLTVNIGTRYTKAIPILFYIVTIMCFVGYFYVYLFCMIWYVFARSPDLVSATVIVSLGISTEISAVKLFCMFIYIKRIRKLTDDYLELDSQTVPGSRFERNLMRNLCAVKKRAIVYWVVVVGNSAAYIFKAMLTPGRHLPEDFYVIYGLEPMFESPHYEMAWTTMASSVVFVCYISANVSGYLVVVTGYAESQILALSEEVTNIWKDANEYYEAIKSDNVNYTPDIKAKIINEHINTNLKFVMKRHALLKSLLERIEGVFSIAIALGFVFLILGLIAELLGGLENTLLELPYAVAQVGVDCFIGQRVIDACNVFERAVYDCKWENFDKNNMKMVLVMLQNSQRTVALSAGGLTDMSFTFLMTCMRATYSAYTALHQTMHKKTH